MSRMKLALEVVQDMRTLADSLEALAIAVMGEEPADPVLPPTPSEEQVPMYNDQPQPTLVELRAFVVERTTPENRSRIKAILEKFGVKKLTELAENQYSTLMNEVAAL